MSAGADSEISTAPESQSKSTPMAGRKPRFALFIATACGLGYLPKAPGTWGSLMGVLIYAATQFYYPPDRAGITVGRLVVAHPNSTIYVVMHHMGHAVWNAYVVLPLALLIGAIGVWASNRVAHFSGIEDPQFVVIDEVSGQLFAYFLAVAAGNWKYLLLGFILFRVFDIWKPFPARQAESLPGGWGIMTDDWAAAVYAGIGLWIARAAGL
ncbi:MAG TPA: phosphatidylglycerophosphatase A [Verrucomicrobiae bacterium]|nr:phosphatidylglycerophosphatase A [Verrucomicrobiae bacterium]